MVRDSVRNIKLRIKVGQKAFWGTPTSSFHPLNLIPVSFLYLPRGWGCERAKALLLAVSAASARHCAPASIGGAHPVCVRPLVPPSPHPAAQTRRRRQRGYHSFQLAHKVALGAARDTYTYKRAIMQNEISSFRPPPPPPRRTDDAHHPIRRCSWERAKCELMTREKTL